MTTRSLLLRAARPGLGLLLLLGGCSPDSVLFKDDPSLAGADSGGVAGRPSTGGSVNSQAGASPNGGAAGDTAGGANSPPSNAGASGTPNPSCTASGAEICNGRDDDCNGVVDDGCPAGITTSFAKDLPLLGDSPGGSAFADDCQDGDVMSGVDVTAGAFLSQIRGVCRPLSLELNPNAEHGYRILLGETRALAPHPAASSDLPTTLACPSDEALVGVRLAQQHYTLSDSSVVAVTARLWVSCAKLILSEHDGKLCVTWAGPKELAPVSGSIANGTAWLVAANAPVGLVASRLLGASGSWVDRVGLGLSELTLVLR